MMGVEVLSPGRDVGRKLSVVCVVWMDFARPVPG